MRVEPRIRAALAGAVLLLVVGGAGGAPALEDSGAPCTTVAERPRTIRIDGRPAVAARHAVVCEAPVAEIVVRGSLSRDGDEVARVIRTCAWASSCVATSSARNPGGVQVWRGRTAGSYRAGGATRSLLPATSPSMKA